MSEARGPITEADLHGFADDRLAPSRRLEVEAWIAERPDQQERVNAWMRDNALLRARLDPIAQEPIPLRLPTHRPAQMPWRTFAVAASVAIVSALLGWFARDFLDAPAGAMARARAGSGLAGRAAIAHAVYTPEVRRPVEVGGQQEDQLVTWLSKRMDAPMKPPHLQSLGYELVGGRLLPGERGPAAQFMYQDRTGQRLTLYVAREGAGKDTAFRFEKAGAVNVFYWIDGPFGYAISAGADNTELRRVAQEVYRSFTTPP
jgi:anti-sigma factor RsiW